MTFNLKKTQNNSSEKLTKNNKKINLKLKITYLAYT